MVTAQLGSICNEWSTAGIGPLLFLIFINNLEFNILSLNTEVF